jgi:hypothetical protein
VGDTSQQQPKPWERQPGESITAFRAFTHYLQRGRDRNGAAEFVGITYGSARNYSSRFHWERRVRAWDDEQAKAEAGEDSGEEHQFSFLACL